MTTPKALDRVPPYFIQLPTSSRQAAIMIESFGPCLFNAHDVDGVATTKANKNEVETQLMTLSEVSKYWAAVFDTGAKAIQSHETTMLSRTSWKRPKNRRL